MPTELPRLLTERFIQRRDVKAVQHSGGTYSPDRTPWKVSDLTAHLAGERTFGHYMVDPDGMTKLFAFDLDLRADGVNPDGEPQDSREVWRTHFDSDEKKALAVELNCLAEGLARKAHRLTECHVAAAESGSKGIHVYCFTGPIPAADARAAARMVLESFGVFELERGDHIWKHTSAYPNVQIEVYPKQDTLDGKDLGNLMRLPLGIHRKTNLPGQFIQFGPPLTALMPMDAEAALSGTLPWSATGE